MKHRRTKTTHYHYTAHRLDSVQYNKFGAKTSQLYGNGIKTNYTYYPLTQRLDSLLTTYSGNTLSYLQYTYDSVGNIIRVNSSYSMLQYQVTEQYTYDSADQLLSAASTCNNNVLCSGAYSYNNWGKINTYTQQTTDPATNASENKDYRYYFPGSSADMAQGQTSFAPIIKYDMQQNPQPLETCTYGINGSIRKRYDHPTQNTDYYYFNASGNLKACGTDMQISVYGYNSANTRTYKVNMFNANQWVNGQPQPIQPMVQSAMFYPNTYINFTQAGEYTKHYYNGTERIASRLGEQQIPISVENEQELEVYQQDVKQIIYNAIGQHLYDEPTDMQEGDVIPLEFLQATGDNNAIFYYHPNHLASTMYVTDAQQSLVQSFLYAPYGDIISEYNTGFNGNVLPNYAFNAKELDEETGFYYYEARYYNPPTFISRDPLMSEKPWLTPYHYCSNNPIGRVDPSGKMDDEWEFDERGNLLNTKTNDEKDIFIVKKKDGSPAISKDYSKGTIKMLTNKNGEKYWQVKGDENAKELFEFLANNSSVEWGHFNVSKGGTNGRNYLVTSHSEDNIAFSFLGISGFIKTFNHNHPNGTTTPSDKDWGMYDYISYHNWEYSEFQNKEFNCNIYTNKNGQSKYTPFYNREYYNALNNMLQELFAKPSK